MSETTPAGGTRSEAILTDATGAVVDDPAVATAVEIVEYDADGDELARTYGRTDIPRRAAASDMDDEDMDAPKGTWDVAIAEDGRYRLVTTLRELEAVMDAASLGEAGWRSVLASMTVLPSWDAMPEGLRAEITALLERRPTTAG